MKKINKSPGPNNLTSFLLDNPVGTWEDFRNHDAGKSYKGLRKLIFDDQGGLCAYCECDVSSLPEHKQRVEHYHSKSDGSDPEKNWALDWDNVLGVCVGGIYANTTLDPLPENLSCDSYKDHIVTKGSIPGACEGYFLNPLLVIVKPCLFAFDKSNGELIVDVAACEKLAGIDSKYSSTEEYVKKTIEILNLNCDRLKRHRLEVLKTFNKEFAKAKKSNDKLWRKKLAECWFSNSWPSFFSTRRILLGASAEAYLREISYSG